MSRMPVAIFDLGEARYPEAPPYDPPERYPESPYASGRLDPSNHVYPAVRESLRLLGLDAGRCGTPEWNPLGGIVRPGDHVVVKPNLVRHFHGAGRTTESLITHGSIVRAMIDYVLIALRRGREPAGGGGPGGASGGARGEAEGRITVGDAPLQYADFASCLRLSGVGEVIREVQERSGFPLGAVDFRKERSEKRRGVIVARIPNEGDPSGYRIVDLGARSRFHGLDERFPLFRVTQYDPATMGRSHNASGHAYLFPGTILDADVLINLPKLKTHGKAGITAAMKNLVGINGSKDWLPHHASGSLAEGGDEYLAPSVRKRILARLRDRIEAAGGRVTKRVVWLAAQAIRRTGRLLPFPDPYSEGSWYGNDTIWRTVHDLHRAFLFSDGEGVIREEPRRRHLALVDGIVAGEGDGPMRPTPKPAGLLVASASPLAADLACCRIMGFDERRVPILNYALGEIFAPPLEGIGEVEIRSNVRRWAELFRMKRRETLAFAPPPGWIGHVELEG